MSAYRLHPVTLAEASAFIAEHHRHHRPPVGWKWGTGLVRVADDALVGVVCVGRPVARHRDDGRTLEVTRLCTDGTPNAASRLLAAAWRAAQAMGYDRLGTYILDVETGASLKAAGWRFVREAGGGSWSCASRPRIDRAPLGRKQLWEAAP